MRKLIFQINFSDERKCGDVYGKQKKLKAPLNTRSQRERKEIAKMGAKASNQTQRNKKLLKEATEVLLATSADANTKATLKRCRISDSNCTYAMAVVVAQLKKAISGATKAFIALRDVLGENPKFTEQEDDNKDKSIVINVVPASERRPE